LSRQGHSTIAHRQNGGLLSTVPGGTKNEK
jgi:hypothetical protein